MSVQDKDCLLERQRSLEEEAIGLGLARASRVITGERTQEDVDAFGGEKTDGARRRQYAFLHMLATEGLSKLTDAIEERRKTCGDKSKKTYRMLQQCGTDAELAGVVIKAVFTALCNRVIDKDDDDEDVDGDDEHGVSIITVAKDIAETLYNLGGVTVQEKQRKVKYPKRPDLLKKEEKLSLDVLLKPALELLFIYLNTTQYYHRNRETSQLEMTDTAISTLAAEIITEQPNDNTVLLDADANRHLLAKNMISPRWPPMLVPPRPWNSMMEGGYREKLSTHVTLIKKCRKRNGFSKEKCPEVFEAINHLQETSFKINRCVFSAFSRLFSAFTAFLQPVHRADVEHIKRYEILLDLPDSKHLKHGSSLFRKKYWSQFSGLHIEAESFLDDQFYFVHNCDFRGRIYPKASNLNYQSGDLRRSLLVFSEGKSIHGKAARWLKRHGANCYAEKNRDTGIGIDKSPFEKRESWVDANEQAILELGCLAKADNIFDVLPTELEEWWLKADKPWAFLAWAHEWACYTENPDDHRSCLPIEVDGSSNGYQHIAALLRYQKVAEMVNMLPRESPNDIYSSVSNHASYEIAQYKDSSMNFPCLWQEYQKIKHNPEKSKSENNELSHIKRKILAISMKNKLSRSTAKKIIMTYPYSAKLNSMARKLEKEKGIFEKWNDTDKDAEYSEYRSRHKARGFSPVYQDGFDIDAFAAEQQEIETGDLAIRYLLSETLASAICECIETSFPEVHCILEWFKQIGNKASGILGNICWESPSGFPVQQHYEKQKKSRIAVMNTKFTCMENTGKINIAKHTNAFGPNFIHSCDAAHLVKTVNSAYRSGITSFRMIHDSYATHAADMDKLFSIIREKFIQMYDEANILDDLRKTIIQKCKDTVDIAPAPMVGDFDIRQVKDAPYFFA